MDKTKDTYGISLRFPIERPETKLYSILAIKKSAQIRFDDAADQIYKLFLNGDPRCETLGRSIVTESNNIKACKKAEKQFLN